MMASRQLRGGKRVGNYGNRVAAQIAKQMDVVIPNIVIQVQQALVANPVNQVNQVNQVEPNVVNAPANSSKCSYKHFKS
ncbi:hypothetical protein Hdeb2414_s1023g00973741 [Helianthus debilis subsp. tardiflorus]